MNKKIYIFDLDNTLAPSKSKIDSEMVRLLSELTTKGKLAIISGGKFSQFKDQVFSQFIGDESGSLVNVVALPTCGSRMCVFDETIKDWKELYAENLSDVEKDKIITAMKEVLTETSWNPEKVWGEIIEDRGSQIAMSMLGQQASVEVKETWDPGGLRLKDFHERLSIKIGNDFDVKRGGTTTIDVTRLGIDKAYGIRKLQEFFGYGLEDMVFVGDRLEEGGNDYPVFKMGVESIATTGPEKTKEIISAFIK